jgi:Ni/Fe-hydrogenase subunit HybB-like protein
VLTALLIPLPFWCVRRCRRNVALMFWLSLSVNVGMFLERYLLVITPQSLKQQFVFTWVGAYQPQPIEYVITVGAFALVALGILLFAKVFPIVPLWDVKEGQVLQQEVRVGRRKLPATIHE